MRNSDPEHWTRTYPVMVETLAARQPFRTRAEVAEGLAHVAVEPGISSDGRALASYLDLIADAGAPFPEPEQETP